MRRTSSKSDPTGHQQVVGPLTGGEMKPTRNQNLDSGSHSPSARLSGTTWCWLLLISLAIFPIACGEKSENEKIDTPSQASPETQLLKYDPQNTGALKGKVSFVGKVPPPQELPIGGNPECKVFHSGPLYDESLLVKNGALQNVFVYVKEGLGNYTFETPKDPVKIDQRKCIYLPRVAGVQVNQPILFINSDPTLHNVHSYSKNNATWNLGMPFEGMELTQKIENPEVMITLKCDVHPWMVGYIGVLPHPYFAITGEDGTFELKNLPPSEYVIEAWHEKLGTRSQKIKVSATETLEITFSFETK